MIPRSLVEILRQGHTVHLAPDGGLRLARRGPVDPGLLERARREREEIRRWLERREELLSLDWPAGYKGLPREEALEVEERLDRMGIDDPLVRRYNALSWLGERYPEAREHRRSVFRELCRFRVDCPRCGPSRGEPCDLCGELVCANCLRCSPQCPVEVGDAGTGPAVSGEGLERHTGPAPLQGAGG